MNVHLRRLYSMVKARLSGVSLGEKSVLYPGCVVDPEGGVIRIGRRCLVHRGAQLLGGGGSIVIGDQCSINAGCVIYGHGGVTIGDGARIAATTVIISGNHNFDDPTRPIKDQGVACKGIRIGNDVWLAAGVIVLDGVRIADGCVIAAGAVVTKSTEPCGVYMGVPARFFRKRGGKGGGVAA